MTFGVYSFGERPFAFTAVAGLSAISGTAAITFGQSGALAGVGALIGSTSITFSQTGSLHGDEALSGTATLAFGQSGAIAATGQLIGTLPIIFGETGLLAGNGILAGTSPIVFGQTGTLGGVDSCSGTATATFGQAGALFGVGSLQGSAQITFGEIVNRTHNYGAMPFSPASYEIETLHWGFLQALPQKIFDFILETAPREQPRPPEPVIAPMVPKPQSAPVASFVAVPEPIPQDVTVGWEPFHGYARSRVVQVYLDMQPLYREKRAIAAKYAKAANEHDKQLIKDYLARKAKTHGHDN